MKLDLAVAALAASVTLSAGCGGVGFQGDHQPPALRLVHLYPRNGETGVSKTATILAHFSDEVFAENQCLSSEVIDEQTFWLSPCGTPSAPVPALVGCFQFLDSDGQTVTGEDRAVAVLSPLQPLAGAIEYCLNVGGSIHGLKTGPLGADITAVFTTEP